MYQKARAAFSRGTELDVSRCFTLVTTKRTYDFSVDNDKDFIDIFFGLQAEAIPFRFVLCSHYALQGICRLRPGRHEVEGSRTGRISLGFYLWQRNGLRARRKAKREGIDLKVLLLRAVATAKSQTTAASEKIMKQVVERSCRNQQSYTATFISNYLL